jgi:hypothetical protein
MAVTSRIDQSSVFGVQKPYHRGMIDLTFAGIVDRFLDRSYSLGERSCGYRDHLVIQPAIRLLMNLRKSHRVFGRGPARLGGGDKGETLNKKRSFLIDSLPLDSLYFSGERRRDRITEIPGERIGTDRRSIEELQVVAEAGDAELAFALQIDDRVDKRCARTTAQRRPAPAAARLCRGCFVDHAVPIEFEAAEDRGFPRPRRPRQDVSLHTITERVLSDASGSSIRRKKPRFGLGSRAGTSVTEPVPIMCKPTKRATSTAI